MKIKIKIKTRRPIKEIITITIEPIHAQLGAHLMSICSYIFNISYHTHTHVCAHIRFDPIHIEGELRI